METSMIQRHRPQRNFVAVVRQLRCDYLGVLLGSALHSFSSALRDKRKRALLRASRVLLRVRVAISAAA
jgi:hypothetical protein